MSDPRPETLIKPFGSNHLTPLLLAGEALQAEQSKASQLTKVTIDSRMINDLIMLGIGGFTPLTGFMSYYDWKHVCEEMQLENGLFWPIPITLSVDKQTANQIKVHQEIALVDNKGALYATMKVEEKYTPDKKWECQNIYKTTDDNHPGVKRTLSEGEINLAGPIKVLSEGNFAKEFKGVYLKPAETRKRFAEKGWKSTVAFQTRNPMHRSHEYLVKIALEMYDGVLIHSLLGAVKEGDIPAAVRIKAITALIDNYFPPNSVIQAGYPLDMRYAGPREALLHALFRQNFGCNYLIIGRDHAGVGSYYGPFDAQKIFNEIPHDALQIKPLNMEATFWCHLCQAMTTCRTCPHDESDHFAISGTKLRQQLRDGEPIPEYFSRPAVISILRQHGE